MKALIILMVLGILAASINADHICIYEYCGTVVTGSGVYDVYCLVDCYEVTVS